jgi:5,10-methenyltetrahydrofolate synthetase
MEPEEEEQAAGYASPPCYLHEVDPAYAGLPSPAKPPMDRDLLRWRKAERERLIAERLAVAAALRAGHATQIAAGLGEIIGDPAGRIVSAYWPFRGEPDLRPWLEQVWARGGRAALPVVLAKGTPLSFRLWRAGAPLVRGVWNIPVPAEGEEVVPDIVIAPLVGFDRDGYRLGYGGGFFDRTLAALPGRQAIGVGYSAAILPTIHPQWHDVPMQVIVTESEVLEPARKVSRL